MSIPKSPPKKLKTDAAPDTKKAPRADKIGKQKTTPVVKTKETKSEFKKLQNEWNASHEKLTENFRDLNLIFSDIKFLLDKLEKQLEAAGIESGINECSKMAQSCLDSFSGANANASALCIKINQLDEKVFKDKTEIKETFKELTEKVALAGKKFSVVAGDSADASNGTVKKSSKPVRQFRSAFKESKELLEKIKNNIKQISDDGNSLSTRIADVKRSLHSKDNEIRNLSSRLIEAQDSWEEKYSKYTIEVTALGSSILTDAKLKEVNQSKINSAREELSKKALATHAVIKDILEKLEKINEKLEKAYKSAEKIKLDKIEFDNLLKLSGNNIKNAKSEITKATDVIDESNLGRKNKKEVSALSTEINKNAKIFQVKKVEIENIESNFSKISEFISKNAKEIKELKFNCKKYYETINEFR